MPYSIKTALIDADIILYRVGFACQHTDWSVYLKGEEQAGRLAQFPNKTELNKWVKDQGEVDEYTYTSNTWTEPIANALHSAHLMIRNVLDQTKATEYRLFLTGSNNYRHEVLPSYKAGRAARPLLYADIKKYLIDQWGAEVSDGDEADDQMGIAQTAAATGTTVIASIDKDLLTIPGEHYNFVTDVHQTVSAEEAMYKFDCQMLTGDGVDNICGIKGLGPKTADKLLKGVHATDREAVIVSEYRKYWGDDWQVVYNCNQQLLWILREEINETKDKGDTALQS